MRAPEVDYIFAVDAGRSIEYSAEVHRISAALVEEFQQTYDMNRRYMPEIEP